MHKIPGEQLVCCEHGHPIEDGCSLPHHPQKTILRHCGHQSYQEGCPDCVKGGPELEGPVPAGFMA